MAVSTNWKQDNWRFYDDDYAEPSWALADENTKPTLADNSKIRLRIAGEKLLGTW